MRVLSFSETGCVRKNNEDAYLILPEYGVYAVADGMGGHLAGEVAARTALDELTKSAPHLVDQGDDELENQVREILIRANREVYMSSTRNPATEGMGTTLTVLVFRESKVVLAHVGDSRAYVWRNEQLVQLTRDHSLVSELVRLGQISSEEADSHPKRHMLVRAVGAGWDVEVDSQSLDFQAGDVFFLCTDGVSNVMSDRELEEEFLQKCSWEEHLERIYQLIIERGAPDNFTALCCIAE
ncbi:MULTISPECIES: Stp1/IreP family PP2C-type Ser/Thr phosphatase [Desulfitobacterium]|uniref:Serine/threonine protein phosphatase n=1 Tax=Desulfitobacterium dehalogenans (strain ATCC 51507 / DSM 9161 / JW/IU-DC1) TaxID=756499 RepID=I4ACA9_DESDJ|nr:MULTISPECIES: Stp1/IreP family PP2C-type Ser/Thr phosphatase [Desulfitobacterium]AFM01594.1 serine/threonine protein phosphatase [Desulfitobacterium dehalogenans ATCC 51507]